MSGADGDRLRMVHEYSLVSSLLDRIEAEARAREAVSVRRVRVRVGEISGVEIELLRSAYELLRERSICARAELEIERQEAIWSCPQCRREAPAGSALHCVNCDLPLGLVAGDDIILEQIEMEVSDV